MNKTRRELFITALLQVSLVSMNIAYVSRGYLVAMGITGFLISFIWTLNVRKVAFGDFYDRISYSAGAAVGTLFGYFISHYITKLFL